MRNQVRSAHNGCMRAPRVVITARLYIGLIFGLTFGLILGMPTVANAATYPKLSLQGVVASGLETPWGLAFLPDGSALVSERDTGKIKRIDPNGRAGSNVTTIGRVKGVVPEGEGGLLGIAVATPQGSSTPVLFAYLTSRLDNQVVGFRYLTTESV